MYSEITTATLYGIECRFLLVEADISNGMPVFEMIGDLSSEVKEAKERVRTALKNSGYMLPPKRITVNFSPANIRKSGSVYDLSIACALLECLGALPQDSLENTLVIGELGIDASIRSIPGVLPMVAAAKMAGIRTVLLPEENYREAEAILGMQIIPVKNLSEVIDIFHGNSLPNFPNQQTINIEEMGSQNPQNTYDFANVNGQKAIRRACEVAAAGGHNMLMIGPPGSGKSLIAKCMPTIMPRLREEESLELSMIYSVAGLLDESGYVHTRPFRSPHHTITAQSLIGGGVYPHPGEITLADHGILFLDELAEFKRSTLELLRLPMEEKKVRINRVQGFYEFPADFQLIAAMNPCPCGFYPDRNRCNCTEPQLKNYFSKISGPFLDRIDICVDAPVISFDELNVNEKNESSAEIRKRVEKARNIQKERYQDETFQINSALDSDGIRKYCTLTPELERFAKKIYEKMNLSVRGYYKILRTARTIADLCAEENIQKEHLLEAVSYRELAYFRGRQVN